MPQLPAGTRGWLTTSLAELEERDGRAAAADAAYRKVLRLGPDSYAAIAYADFLIAQRRPGEAIKLLKDEARTDAVLLRLAIAGSLAKTPGSERDVAEMRERIALANERPEARSFTAASRRCSRWPSSTRPNVRWRWRAATSRASASRSICSSSRKPRERAGRPMRSKRRAA